MSHSKTGASSAYRWIECTKSATLPHDKTTSIAAEEGTKKHEAIYEYFENGTEVDDSLMPYISFIESMTGERLVEQKVTISSIDKELYGTADCLIHDEHTLHVIDYKSGALKVSPVENAQLIFYAIGAIDTFKFNQEKVMLHIFQNNEVSSWELTKINEMYWRMKFENAFNKTIQSPEYKVGHWCDWCPSIRYCEKAKHVTGDLIETEHAVNMSAMGSDELYQYIKHKKLAEKFLSACEQEAIKRLKQGRQIQGLSLKQGKRLKRWNEGHPIDEKFFEKKPMTVSSAIKKFGDLDGWQEIRSRETLNIEHEIEFNKLESDLW